MRETTWQRAKNEHRCVEINVPDRLLTQYTDLVQKFFAQTLVVQIQTDYGARRYIYTVVHPELPEARLDGHVMRFELIIDLTTRTPSCYAGNDKLLRVSL